MRTKKSIRNAIVSMIMNVIMILIGLVSQKIFLHILGTEYLGISGLFSNIISMLGIVELGIGPAIIYNLYRPIKENDTVKIKALINFYKKVYNIIAALIFILGILLIPILPYILKDVNIPENITLIYILFLTDTFVSYLAAYKQSILYANQENYIINIIHIAYLLVMNFSQLFLLYITKNYYLYLITKIICRALENIVISIVVVKKYPTFFIKNQEKIDSSTSKDILTRTKGLIFHKIGTFIVDGSDNIIISTFLGITTVGLYTNYSLILNAVTNLTTQVFSAITSSVGNLLVSVKKEKNYEVFKNIYFINFVIATVISVGFLCCIQPFISIWIGRKYLLSSAIAITLAINLYIKILSRTMNTFKEAAGIFYEDRYIPILQSVINIIVSILLSYCFGLAGVFIGTIVSNLLLHLYSYPKYVYKQLFSDNVASYFKIFIKYLLTFILILIICYLSTIFITVNSTLLQLLLNILISLILSIAIIIVIFKKTSQFIYCQNIGVSMINRGKKK